MSNLNVPYPHAASHAPGGSDQVTGSVPLSGAALPGLPNASYPVGTLFCRTSDFTLWRSNGASWDQLGGGGAGSSTSPQKPVGNLRGVISTGSTIGINQIRLVRYTIEQAGSWIGATVYTVVTDAAKNHAFGVYSPTVTNLTKLTDSPTAAIPAANVWTDFTFNTPIAVTVGQQVLAAIHTDSSTASWGRPANPVNNAQAQLPAGYITDADASNLLCMNFNRGSFSSPLPNSIAVASLTATANLFVFYMKYA